MSDLQLKIIGLKNSIRYASNKESKELLKLEIKKLEELQK